MQLENDFPMVPVVDKQIDQLSDNHIGVWFESHDRYSDTNFVYSNGFSACASVPWLVKDNGGDPDRRGDPLPGSG